MSKTINTDYYKLAIQEIEPQTEKAVTLTFNIPPELQQQFAVTPGQYIKLKTTIANQEEERFYSICNYSDNTIQVAIKRVEDGTFSNYACDNLRTNDMLSVQAPQGDYHLPDASEIAKTKRYCFIAAGSGITPNLAMIRYLLTQTEHTEVNLIYVNKRRSETMFFDEIEGLKNTYMKRFSVTYLMTREPSAIDILSKRPDLETAGKIVDQFIGAQSIDHIYLCGPLPLIDVFRNSFIDRGIAKKAIHMELFGTTSGKAKLTNAEAISELPFHKLMVTEVSAQTANAKAITFSVPENLSKDFSVIAGQYIKLRANFHGETVERFYSISDFGKDFIQVGIKKVEDGLFSNYACDSINVGDVIDVQQPQGNFCLSNTEIISKEKRYFFVAAGSGITPNLAMIRTLLKQHHNIEINLLYINTKRADIMFFEELEELKNTHLGRLNIIYVLTREPRGISILSQRPDSQSAGMIIDGLVGRNIDQAFMCGPLALIELFRNALIERGIEKKRIHLELFGTQAAPVRKVTSESDGKDLKSITIINQGVEQKIKIRPDQDILDAALEAGIMVPYACKGGVCATCKAQCLDGKSEMVLNYGLEDDEVERGMVLTCQTYVTSETGTFDFDVQ